MVNSSVQKGKGRRPGPRRSPTVPKIGSVLVVAGEHSGDLLGAAVVKSLQRSGVRDFFGTGGSEMQASGVELLESAENMEVIGFVEAFRAYRKLKALAGRLVEEARRRQSRFALLIDYPGFNLRLAEMLRAAGVKTVFLVSPQFWAWKYNRIHGIRRNVDLMLVLFPFEKEIYDREGVRAECVGHPMVERIPRLLKEQEQLPRQRAGALVGLLPGSRGSEVHRLFPDMLRAAAILSASHPRARFVVPLADTRFESFVREQIGLYPNVNVEYVGLRSLRVMEAADVVIVASGTATLETAYFKTPMVIAYRVGWVNFLLASLLARTRYVGLANLLARKQVAVELLQTEATAENMAAEAARLLDDAVLRRAVIKELDFVRSALGRGNPASRAASAFLSFVRETERAKNAAR